MGNNRCYSVSLNLNPVRMFVRSLQTHLTIGVRMRGRSPNGFHRQKPGDQPGPLATFRLGPSRAEVGRVADTLASYVVRTAMDTATTFRPCAS